MPGARDAFSRYTAPLLRGMALLPLLVSVSCAAPRPAPALLAAVSAASSPVESDLRVSLRHFDHLFAEATIGGERVGVLNIYSEAPDYRFAIEPREGYACVDDVARGMVLLAAMPTLDAARRRQLDLMTRFVLRLQADNGYFHNFIWAGGRINRDYRTSRAQLNWWSLRALWGLEAAMTRLPADAPLAMRARVAADRLVANLKRDLPAQGGGKGEGASWLPFGSGADAGATAMLGLMAHYRRTGDPGTRALLARLGEGLVQRQAGDARRFPFGAYRSWRDQWHAWGNAQAYALLRAGALLDRPDFTASALIEVDHFYPYLMEHGMLASFTLRPGAVESAEIARFPQIAYGISPMVLAATEAYRVTGKAGYRTTAQRLAQWFAGRNDATRPMYDPATGRVLDGITGSGAVNANAGAESTVEGLLALTALGGTPLP
ncbi:hypothetical protein DVW87_15600 [Sphingomonas aracearum]|uniref:Glycosyl hydrolase n=2 Tax=Sphingomonas aracearum TaxID=2283317 RepID=A0A369VSZ5_9SPHN|nr:hypothetical protein DVW87_15600 [Sphingomonas aracearum]